MESKSTQVILSELNLICGTEEAAPIDGGLSFDPSDPLAVSLRLGRGEQDVLWTFARDLLDSGVYEPTGIGDVHVWPCLDSEGSAVVIIELCSPDGELLLQADSRRVQAFLSEAARVVPPGSEVVDVDVFLQQLFAV